MRKFLIALILLLGVLFLILRFAEVQDILTILGHGNAWYIGMAVLLELAWLFNLGLTYQSIYQALEIPEEAFFLARMAVAGNFVNVIAPSAGFSSMALFISEARNRNLSSARVTIAAVLFIWFDYIATLIVLFFGLGFLAQRNTLHWSELTASLILLAGALGIGILLFLGMESAELLAKALTWLAQAVNFIVRPFLHRSYLSIERAYEFAHEAAEGVSTMRHRPSMAVRPVLFALLNKLILISILSLSFLAFKVSFNLQTVVAGFSLASLFLIVSPTPAGVGIVEGVLTVALSGLGVPISDAAVITLAYRGITFWLQLLFGMIAFRTMRLPVKKTT